MNIKTFASVGTTLRTHRRRTEWIGFKFQTRRLVVCLVTATLASAVAATNSVDSASVEAWRAFRVAQPFQLQVIAVSPRSGAAPGTLILSEPPPTVAWAKLKETLAPHTSACEVREWFLMAGGSVKDVLCTLRENRLAGWADKLSQLQLEVYGTVEGAPVVALPVPKRKMMAHPLNVRFGALDLESWLSAKDRKYRGSPISPALSFSDIMERGARGVFSSDDQTMVLWSIARGGSIDKAGPDVSRFAAKSDLLLGAVANKDTLVIVARNRRETLAHLPPLRSETVLLLAGTQEKQLAQSYERGDLLAGKGSDGLDRAPILLSPQLVDTEFGTLLNVADQLLKGWSMAGQVNYSRFSYPAPATYPFGQIPAPFVEKGRSHFLFNWNTDGAAFRQKVKGLDVVVPQRTGSLSVIYGDPKDRPRSMEDRAYDYFSQSGDTTLVRVVQYTFLYQVFRQFDIRAAKPAVSPRFAEFQKNIDEATRRELRTVLSGMTKDELHNALTSYWATKVGLSLPPELKALYVESVVKPYDKLAEKLRAAESASEGKVSLALSVLAQARRQGSSTTEQAHKSAMTTLESFVPDEDLSEMIDSRAFQRSGLLQIAAEKTSSWKDIASNSGPGYSWNRTAYVVESRPHGSAQSGTGGHNIDAPVIRFSESAAQPRGSISVSKGDDGTWIVAHSPEDAGRAREIAREVGTRKELSKAQIESEVSAALKSSKAEAPVAFQQVAAVTGKSAEFKLLKASESIYKLRPLTNAEAKILSELAASKQDTIVFEQLADGSFSLSRTGSEQALQVASITAATDALSNGLIRGAGGQGSVSVLMKGVADEKAEAMLGFVQSNLRRYPKDTVDHVLSLGEKNAALVERPLLINQRLAHNGIKIDHTGVKVEKVTTGIYEGFSRMEVPITISTIAENVPLRLRLVFFFKELTSTAKAKVLSKIDAILATFKGPMSVVDVHVAINKQLMADFKELGIDTLLTRVDSDATNKMHGTLVGAVDKDSVRVL